VPTVQEALGIARSGTANAPVVPVTEQTVAATNASNTDPTLAAVYPREGSPVMTYPVVHVTTGDGSEPFGRREAVQVVLDRLASPRATRVARNHGFRGPRNEPATGQGIFGGPVQVLAPPKPGDTAAITGRLLQLERPSRILAVLDVSGSMREKLDDGVPRLALAANSAGIGMSLLPDQTAVGIWVFARNLTGTQDWRELVPLRRLGSNDAAGHSQRDVLSGVVGQIDGLVSNSGTGLYDTLLAAFRRMHQTYDTTANNAIIVITDGADDDRNGTTLAQLVAEIDRRNRGDEKVAIYLAGLGPEADYPAMRRVAQASGGWTYRIDSTAQFQSSLLDGLNRSRGG
jgi:hypothetical protein